MVRSDGPSGRRILIFAIALSFIWHIFWLSTVKIVSRPVRWEAVKFSKVAFLGPILSGINMDLRAAPASRSFLERRYRVMASKGFSGETQLSTQFASKQDGGSSRAQGASGAFSLAIDDAVSGEKLECDYPAE